jgi:hypothetical protein
MVVSQSADGTNIGIFMKRAIEIFGKSGIVIFNQHVNVLLIGFPMFPLDILPVCNIF